MHTQHSLCFVWIQLIFSCNCVRGMCFRPRIIIILSLNAMNFHRANILVFVRSHRIVIPKVLSLCHSLLLISLRRSRWVLDVVKRYIAGCLEFCLLMYVYKTTWNAGGNKLRCKALSFATSEFIQAAEYHRINSLQIVHFGIWWGLHFVISTSHNTLCSTIGCCHGIIEYYCCFWIWYKI